MKEEFASYLESIGITETLGMRVLEIYEFYSSICPEKITDVFLADYIKEDGSRDYESLWFFSANLMMEARKFAFEDDFDMCLMRKRVVWWEIKKKDYDFKNATQDSRLSLRVYMQGGIEAGPRAAGKNCDHLRDIILKYVIPNLHE